MKYLFCVLSVAAMLALSSCDCGKNDAVSQTDKSAVVTENILNRKSVRSYVARPVADDTIQMLLRAAMAAPSGMDVRPWRFVVLKDKDNFDAIFEGNMNLEKFKQAGVVLVLCADTTMSQRGANNGERVPNPIWRDDMGACTENLLLQAEALGLGAVWTACYPFADRMATVRHELALPAEVVPYCIVPVGYHDGTTQPKDKWNPDNIHYECW